MQHIYVTHPFELLFHCVNRFYFSLFVCLSTFDSNRFFSLQNNQVHVLFFIEFVSLFCPILSSKANIHVMQNHRFVRHTIEHQNHSQFIALKTHLSFVCLYFIHVRTETQMIHAIADKKFKCGFQPQNAQQFWLVCCLVCSTHTYAPKLSNRCRNLLWILLKISLKFPIETRLGILHTHTN